MVATVLPCAQLKPLSLMERGSYVTGRADAVVAGLPQSVAARELHCIGEAMG